MALRGAAGAGRRELERDAEREQHPVGEPDDACPLEDRPQSARGPDPHADHEDEHGKHEQQGQQRPDELARDDDRDEQRNRDGRAEVRTGTRIPDLFTWLGTGVTFGIPNALALFIPVAALILFIQKRTGFGRLLYAVGDNEKAARLSGAHYWQVILALYVFSSLLAGVAGLLYVGLIRAPSSLSLAEPLLLRGNLRRRIGVLLEVLPALAISLLHTGLFIGAQSGQRQTTFWNFAFAAGRGPSGALHFLADSTRDLAAGTALAFTSSSTPLNGVRHLGWVASAAAAVVIAGWVLAAGTLRATSARAEKSSASTSLTSAAGTSAEVTR